MTSAWHHDVLVWLSLLMNGCVLHKLVTFIFLMPTSLQAPASVAPMDLDLDLCDYGFYRDANGTCRQLGAQGQEDPKEDSGVSETKINCGPGRWGAGCEKRCPEHCADDICSWSFGQCLLCDPGWELGDKFLCDKPCVSGYSGENCEVPCPVRCPYECDVVTSFCLDTPGNIQAIGEDYPHKRRHGYFENANYVTMIVGFFLIACILAATLLGILAIAVTKTRRRRLQPRKNSTEDSESTPDVDSDSDSDSSTESTSIHKKVHRSMSTINLRSVLKNGGMPQRVQGASTSSTSSDSITSVSGDTSIGPSKESLKSDKGSDYHTDVV